MENTKNDYYLILPGCDDTNRGDQALIWETMYIARDAGFDGDYYMIAAMGCGIQSEKVGITSLEYILPHPSSRVRIGKDNRKYGLGLKLGWTIRSLLDLMITYPLSKKTLRLIAEKFLSTSQKKTLDVYKNAKGAFVKGGGFLHAYGGAIETYKIYYFLYHINLAISMGIPVYVMPNSYGPFEDRISRRLVKKCLSKCAVVYSRESISQKILKSSCGINSILSNDLAMFLEKDRDFKVVDYLMKSGINLKSGKTVGITVRPYRFPGQKNQEQLYIYYKIAIKNVICWLNENGYYPILIEHVFSENFHERDILCINEIKNMVVETGQHVDVFSDLKLNCKQMKSIYSSMDYLIGTRFHSVIFSLTENVPVLAITYGGNKGEGIMSDIGLSDYAISIENMMPNVLIDKFQLLLNNEDHVLNCLEKNKMQVIKNYEVLVSSIEGVYK